MSVRHERLKRQSVRDGDPWSVLGLRPGATPAEIRQAFRRRIKECHPDSPTARNMHMQSVCSLVQAYRLLEKHLSPQVVAVPESDGEGLQKAGAHNLNEGLFLFLEVSAEDAFKGATVETTVSDCGDCCPSCSGLGHVSRSDAPECGECSGRGFKEVPWGKSRLRIVCSECGGSGRIIRRQCRLCRGQGTITRERTVQVKLPRGTRDGMVLKLPGQGQWRQERQSRDPLFAEIKVRLPEEWTVRNLDIHSTVSVDIWTAMAGGPVTVETVEGMESFMLDPCSFISTDIVLKAKGWIDEAGNRGDHVARIEVVLPQGGPPPAARTLIRWLRYVWPAGPCSVQKALPPSKN